MSAPLFLIALALSDAFLQFTLPLTLIAPRSFLRVSPFLSYTYSLARFLSLSLSTLSFYNHRNGPSQAIMNSASPLLSSALIYIYRYRSIYLHAAVCDPSLSTVSYFTRMRLNPSAWPLNIKASPPAAAPRCRSRSSILTCVMSNLSFSRFVIPVPFLGSRFISSVFISRPFYMRMSTWCVTPRWSVHKETLFRLRINNFGYYAYAFKAENRTIGY